AVHDAGPGRDQARAPVRDAASAATTSPRVRVRELPRSHPRYRRQSLPLPAAPRLPLAPPPVPTPPLLALQLPARLLEPLRRSPLARCRPSVPEQPLQLRTPTTLRQPLASPPPVLRSPHRLPVLPRRT